MRRLLRVLRVQPAETRVVTRLLALIFALSFGLTVGGNGVESLLLARVGARILPYLFMVVGPATFAVMMGASAVLSRGDVRRALADEPLAVAGFVLLSRAMLLMDGRWVFPVLWLVMMVLWTGTIFAAWGLAGAVHDTRQAKRLFPLYGAALILGIVTGGFATGPLAILLGTENLLLVWAAVMVGSWWLARSVLRAAGPVPRVSSRERRPAAGMREAIRTVRGSPLLRSMAIALALFALLYFAVTFLFSAAAAARFPEAERLAGFLGLFVGTASGTALLGSLFVSNRLFARFGVVPMILVLPFIYLAGFSLLAVTSAFVAVVAFRFVQMVWVNGVWGAGWQALFVVVPPDRRGPVRTFMDAVPLQAGVVAAGAMLVLAERVLTGRQLAIIGAVLAAGAAVAVWRTRRAYVVAVAEALREGNPELFSTQDEPFVGFPRDRAALAAVEAGAMDAHPMVRRLSLEILAGLGDEAAAGSFQRGLSDDDPIVRASAIRGLAGSGPASSPSSDELEALLRDPDGDVRCAAVDAAERVGGGPETVRLLRPLLSDPDPAVRARAAVRSIDAGAEGDVLNVLVAMSASPRSEDRALAVGALGEVRLVPDIVLRALQDPEASVRRGAVAAMGRFPAARAVEPLLEALADADSTVCRGAAEALGDLGPEVAPRVMDALGSADLEAGALLALARLPVANPVELHAYARMQASLATRYGDLRGAVSPNGDDRTGLLAYALEHRARRHALNAINAAAALAGEGSAVSIRLAIDNLTSRDQAQRANALETLDALGETRLVRPLLPLWEAPPERPEELRLALFRIIADDDPWLRACAAVAAGAVADDPEMLAAVDRLARWDPDEAVRDAAAGTLGGGPDVETLTTLSLMERVLFLRKVPLFADLAPADVRQIAEVATEHVFGAGETIAEQGEAGDALHVVVAGTIQVLVDGARVVATRGVGEYVGEMAIISEEPRMASLVATAKSRTLSIDRMRFERLVRERPEASLAVIRELGQRLRDASTRMEAHVDVGPPAEHGSEVTADPAAEANPGPAEAP